MTHLFPGSRYGRGGDIPTYDPSQFEQMLEENQVDTVIVTTMDRVRRII
jgi:hypothetical protein